MHIIVPPFWVLINTFLFSVIQLILINLLRYKINHLDFSATKKKLFRNFMRRLCQWLYYWTFLFTDVFKLLGFSYFTIVEHSYRARGIVCRSKKWSRWNHDGKIKLVTICRFWQSLHNLDRLIPKAEWIKSFLDCFLSKPSLCIRYWIFLHNIQFIRCSNFS